MTYPELLLSVARSIKHPADQVLAAEGLCGRAAAVVALALDFDRRPVGFRLRALIEGWNEQRVMREMY